MSNTLLRNTIFILLFILGGSETAFATHIIGGEMNYKCLGNNDYEISLTVYRDCFLGEAQLDDTAYVAIFDFQGNLIDTLPILLGKSDTIVQFDECLLIPPNICVETTTYIDTINLSPRIGGYHLAYQRCCRNGTILNIIDPLNTGATYDIIITEEAMQTCNSSPRIKEWPPTFVCVNRPLIFENTATDIDGDSLSFRLCTPYDGGISVDNPRPRPSLPPPFDTVVWNSSTYSLDNILGGIPLKIDPKTGTLTGTPNIIGQFVVGICLDEFRNGQLISTTRRDFQYNVIPCEDVVADFTMPVSQCENLTVSPENNTEGEPDGYFWKFLDNELNLLHTSTEKSPTYDFRDTGNYVIRLIVNPNSVCADSIDQNIYLHANSLVADFQYNILGCADSLVLQFTDNSVDSLGEIESWNWTINGEFDQYSSAEQNPTFTILNSQLLQINLQVFSDNGCFGEKNSELEAFIIPDSFSVSTFDTLVVCKGDSIELNPIYNPQLSYLWSPPNGLSDITAPNPKAFPDSSTAYVVMIRDSGGICELRKNVFLEVIDFDNSFDFSINTLECGDSLLLQLEPNPNYDLSDKKIHWEVNNDGQQLIFSISNPIFVIKNSENIEIIGTVADQFGCSKSVIKNTQIELVKEEIQSMFSLCRGDSIALNPDFNPNYTYDWSPVELFSDPTLPNPVIAPNSNVTVAVTIHNAAKTCPVQKAIDLQILNTIENADFQFKLAGCTDSLALEITDVTSQPVGIINSVNWELIGDIEQLTSTEFTPTFVLKNSQFVQLELTVNPNSLCPKTISKSFRVNLLEDIALEESYTICKGESVALNPKELFPNYVYSWTPESSLDNANGVNPIASPNETTIFQVSYSDSTGLCQVDKSIEVIILDTLPKIGASTVINCDGLTAQFTPNSDALITYNFGDNTPEITINTTEFIEHTFPASGTYIVSLKYADATICSDSTTIEIVLPEDNISPNFEWNVESCNNNIASLKFIDLSKAIFGEITNWEWQLSNGFSSNDKTPVFPIENKEPISANLVITLDNNNQCKDSITMEIPALLIEEEIPDSLFACVGSTIALNPDFNENYSYSWSPNEGLSDANSPNPTIQPANPQQYLVQISNDFGCLIMDSVFTSAAPTIEINTIEIPVVCDTMDVVLMAESEQTNQLFWQNENGDTLGFDPELLVNIVQPELFTATFTDDYGCQNKATVFVDFQPILLDYEENQATCLNSDKTLIINNLNSSNNLKFDWIPTQDIINGENTISPTVRPEEPTTFTFNAGNEAGCKTSGAIFVDILPLPIVAVSAEPESIFEGESSQLNATNDFDYIYEWSPNNSLNNPTISNPIASPNTTTEYTLTVFDENGCSNNASVNVNVQEGICDFPYIFVPSAFTPNDDGQNDQLFVRGTFIDELTFIVYDRWGDKVFETTNQSIGWDGSHNGKGLPPGVFGYYLRAVCQDREVYTKQGNVTLIR